MVSSFKVVRDYVRPVTKKDDEYGQDVVSVQALKNRFFYTFRKYNILRVYCKNFRAKYEIFTKLQHIVESALRLIN